jgi:hypothetical protein
LLPLRISLTISPGAGRKLGGSAMDVVHFGVQPVVSLIAGVLILIMPQLLNYIVAIYLIVIGVIGISPHLMH